jgi:hypothetical protein
LGAVHTACQGGGAATRLTADQLHSGSNPDLGFGRGSSEALPGEELRSNSSTRLGAIRRPVGKSDQW